MAHKKKQYADTMRRSERRQPPKKKRRVSRRGWVALGMVAAALLLAALLLLRWNEYRLARREYEAYAALPEATPQVIRAEASPVPATLAPVPSKGPAVATAPLPTKTPFTSEKVTELKKQNKDTVGWIEVPDTTVAYPMVQGSDNDYYMTHSFAKRKRASGAIFLDVWNSAGFTDFNSVVYGHNMKDGSMFHPLREYRHADFLREHKYIEVVLLHSKRTYKVFAAYTVEDDFDFRGLGLTTQKDKEKFITRITNRSEIKTNTEAGAGDTLLTLVTCTSGSNSWYWIVHAVLVEEAP